MELIHRIRGAFDVAAPGWLLNFLLSFLLSLLPISAQADSLNRDALQMLLPPGLIAGELDPLLPVRPVFARNGTQLELRGYVFETVNFEPARGYSGKPINLLVTLASDGTFLGVRLLSHREPIFVSERGNNLLVEFARQYEGLTFRYNTQIVGAKDPSQRSAGTAHLTGVTQGTVSARAIDRAIIQASILVARSRMESDGKGSANRQTVDERFRPMNWQELVSAQWITSLQLSQIQIDARFAATPAASPAPPALSVPSTPSAPPVEPAWAVDLWATPLSHAQVGRNLLDDKGWAYVRSIAESGQHVWLAIERGQLRLSDANRALLLQGGNSYELREIDFDHTVKLPVDLGSANPPPKVRLFRTIDAHSLDINAPIEFALSNVRRYGTDALQRVRVDWSLVYPQRPPSSSEYAVAAKTWQSAWQERNLELTVLTVALSLLVAALARPRWLSAHKDRLRRFRIAYLVFTLGFIGWYAQAQLSVVNLTATVEALRRNEDLLFLLFDPMTVCLWGFVLLTLFAWGRGTFCGWLCPFGALQELLSLAARALGIKGIRLTQRLDQRLKYSKYGVLVMLIASAALLSPWTDQAVEIEPFKTAINMGFERTWPYVAWAAACALSSVFVFRGYCRYVCPLGAALAVLGSVRLLNWIPRRAECGTPCQTCRHRCEYQAIKPTGKVDYRECFQCQDCVTIYQDSKQCLPLVRMHRKPQAVSTIVAAPART